MFERFVRLICDRCGTRENHIPISWDMFWGGSKWITIQEIEHSITIEKHLCPPCVERYRLFMQNISPIEGISGEYRADQV